MGRWAGAAAVLATVTLAVCAAAGGGRTAGTGFELWVGRWSLSIAAADSRDFDEDVTITQDGPHVRAESRLFSFVATTADSGRRIAGTFHRGNKVKGYRGDGRIEAQMAHGNYENFAGRLLTADGKLIGTFTAFEPIRRKRTGKIRIFPKWSRLDAGPGDSVKLTATIKNTGPDWLVNGVAKVWFSIPSSTFRAVAGFTHMRSCDRPVDVGAQTRVGCRPLALGPGDKTTVTFLLHIPSTFPGARLGVGMDPTDYNSTDAYKVVGQTIVALYRFPATNGTGTTVTPTTPAPKPPPAKAVNPTSATCVPASFTMQGLASAFSATFSQFISTGGFRCLWRTSDGAEAFVVFVELSGTCTGKHMGDPPYDSRTRRVSVSGGTRIGGAHAIGGDDAILKQVLEKAEAQGVGRAC